LFPEVNATPSIVLLKDHDEKKVYFKPGLGRNLFLEAMRDNKLPGISPTFAKYATPVMQKPSKKKLVILLRDATRHEALDKIFKAAREEVQSREFIFLTTDLGNKEDAEVGNNLGVNPNDFPLVMVVQNEEGEIYRFVYNNGEITKEGLVKYLENFVAGKVERTYKNEILPNTTASKLIIVKKVTSKTFKEEVLDANVDVLVKFFAPWCSYCQQLAPVYEEMAEIFPAVKFVEIDSTKNEIENYRIETYPVVMLFQANKKNHPLKNTDNKRDGLIKFIRDNTGAVPESKITPDNPEENVKVDL